MAIVWEDAMDVEGTELLVLLSIADHADDKGVAWPSVARLGARARRAESTVQQALTNLEKRGWLEREFRHGNTTKYRLLRPRSQQVSPSEVPPVDQGVQNLGGSSTPGLGVQDSGLRGPAHRTRTTKEPSVNPGGGVGEVTTEATPPDHPVTEQPFPRFAIAALGSVTASEQDDWLTAWRTVTSQAVQWDAQGHLTKYLARCKEGKKTPKPTEWVRWWVEDEQAERRKARESAASNDETPRPWFE